MSASRACARGDWKAEGIWFRCEFLVWKRDPQGLEAAGRPRSRCTIPPSPFLRKRCCQRRTWRSLTRSRRAASTCLMCPSSTCCSTFNRSRSLALNSIRSVSIPPPTRDETGHSHFAATDWEALLTRERLGSSLSLMKKRTFLAPVLTMILGLCTRIRKSMQLARVSECRASPFRG